jgi:Mitochondrial carrier protein
MKGHDSKLLKNENLGCDGSSATCVDHSDCGLAAIPCSMAEANSTFSSLLPNALGSAAAGIVSRICTHPLDTVKARLQAPPGSTPLYTGPFDALRRTARSEGIRGLYRGFGAVIVGGTPGTVIYLCTYDICRSFFSNDTSDEQHFAVHFVSGMVAETVACLVYVPVDVIKERMQVQHTDGAVGASNQATAYRNSWHALKVVSKTEGLGGIYKGYGATLASFGPFSALYFVFYERFKWMTQQHLEMSRASAVPLQWTILNSAAAGALASWLTSPLDMAKLRLQVQRGNLYSGYTGKGHVENPSHYSGMVDCLRQTFRDGGMKALFRGAGARVLHFAPATTVTMTIYESCRSFFAQVLRQQ